MAGKLSGYVCTCCGLIIVEVAPVSPWCPICAMYGCSEGTLVMVEDAGDVKAAVVWIHLDFHPPAPAPATLPHASD